MTTKSKRTKKNPVAEGLGRLMGNVSLYENERPIFGYQVTDGRPEKVQLGMLTDRSFHGQSLNRLMYQPQLVEDPKSHQALVATNREVYQVGHVTDRFQIIDHADVLDPFLQQGYTIERILYNRGGLNMMAFLRPRRPITVADPIRWDKGQWDSTKDSGQLTETVSVFGSISPRKGIHIKRGWFRLVCTNGLVAEILRLGLQRFSHANWSVARLDETLSEWTEGLADDDSMVAGPLIGTPKGVARFAAILQQVVDARVAEVSEEDDEEDGVTVVENSTGQVIPKHNRRQAIVTAGANLPMFIRDELQAFTATPTWLLKNYIAQMILFAQRAEAAKQRKSAPGFFALDLVNAYTSAANKGAEDGRQILRVLVKMDSVLQSSMKLTGAFSL